MVKEFIKNKEFKKFKNSRKEFTILLGFCNYTVQPSQTTGELAAYWFLSIEAMHLQEKKSVERSFIQKFGQNKAIVMREVINLWWFK